MAVCKIQFVHIIKSALRFSMKICMVSILGTAVGQSFIYLPALIAVTIVTDLTHCTLQQFTQGGLELESSKYINNGI